uniref:Uncharacterized protein n=1 Tax=Avena sativa TaxID=4498 RepID=A0ACD5XGL7_AVESA
MRCYIQFSRACLQFRGPNKPMACAVHLLVLFTLIQLYSVAAYSSHDYPHGHGNTIAASFCHPDQAAALLQLKQSFIFDYSTTTLPSWQSGRDCCLWKGVSCDDGVPGDGHVIALDLGGCGLYSYGFHAALFNLTSLRYLDISMNNFGGSRIQAAGFERLSRLTHLNLSHSGLHGQIPMAIGKLTSLITLDLSSQYTIISPEPLLGGHNNLLLREPSFETLVANLTDLRELYLDAVDISTSGKEWGSGLDESAPLLQVLSMAWCGVHGPIHSSLSSLQYLTVINLEHNSISGVVPEFFADYLNLSLLQLGYNNFSGWFPEKIFQLKNIRVLDVSGNNDLFGHLPEFPNGTSLETLNLYYTDFSAIKLSSLSSLMSLRELGFDAGSISMEPTDLLFDKFNSLLNLQLSFARFSGELEPFLLGIISLKNLTSLGLSGFHSSKIMPPMIGNLTNLINLEITFCHFSGQIPPSIGNLYKLTSLKILGCTFSGTMPSSISNLTKLRSLEIAYSELAGPIITNIGYLSKLMVLVLADCKFSGSIPSTIVNLTHLTYVDLSHNDLRERSYLLQADCRLEATERRPSALHRNSIVFLLSSPTCLLLFSPLRSLLSHNSAPPLHLYHSRQL